jgi:hypothetical protein
MTLPPSLTQARINRVTTMQYQVLVESHPDKVYVASVIGLPDCVAEGQTKEEAVANAKAALVSRLAQGEIVTIEVELSEIPRCGNPWLDNYGRFQSDPTYDDFLAEIEAGRRPSAGDDNSE